MAYLPSCLRREPESPAAAPGACPGPQHPRSPAGVQGALEFGPTACRRPSSGQWSLRAVFCLWEPHPSPGLWFLLQHELRIAGCQPRVWELAPAVEFQA